MILAPGDNTLAIRRKVSVIHKTVMLENKQQPAIEAAPYSCGPIPACCDDPPAVWEKLRVNHPFFVSGECSLQTAVCAVPYACGMVLARGYNEPAVAGKLRTENFTGVSLK